MRHRTTTVLLLATAGLASSFLLSPQPAAVSRRPLLSPLRASGDSSPEDPEALVRSLESGQDEVFASLQGALKVEESDYPDSLGLAVWEKRAVKGEVYGYKGNTKLVWTGRLKAHSYDGKVFHTETAIWVGPLIQVPHLVLSSSVSPEGVRVSLDYVPRDDLAYTTGNNHLRDYYAAEAVQALVNDAYADTTIVARPSPRTFEGRVLQSPAAITLILPPTQESVTKVLSWTQAHVERWVGWMGNAEELQRMKRGQMLSRDTGVRRLWVEAGAGSFTALLGGDKEGGKQLAIAVSGPMQEQYVGGGS